MAARRELAEEIGDRPHGVPTASRGHRLRHLGRAHRPSAFFELRLEQLPELRLDNRETIGARLVQAPSCAAWC
jgi:hypothetical protein